jgi:hypothetical protein
VFKYSLITLVTDPLVILIGINFGRFVLDYKSMMPYLFEHDWLLKCQVITVELNC